MLYLIFFTLWMCFVRVMVHSYLTRRPEIKPWAGLHDQYLKAHCQHASMHVANVLLLDILHICNILESMFTMCFCTVFCTFTTCFAWKFVRYECALLDQRHILNVLQDDKSNLYVGYQVNVWKHIINMLVCTLWTCFCLIFCTFTTCKYACSLRAFAQYFAHSQRALLDILHVTKVFC